MNTLRPSAFLPLVLLPLLWCSSGCKTTNGNSDTKSLPDPAQISQMTLQQWVPICEQELANPQTGAQSKAYLLQATNTTDCAAAYPIILSLVHGATGM